MNRRSFFKIVTGFVAGVVAACVPRVTGSRRSGTRLATEEEVRKVSRDIYKARRVCYPKSAVMGFTEAEVLRSIHRIQSLNAGKGPNWAKGNLWIK